MVADSLVFHTLYLRPICCLVVKQITVSDTYDEEGLNVENEVVGVKARKSCSPPRRPDSHASSQLPSMAGLLESSAWLSSVRKLKTRTNYVGPLVSENSVRTCRLCTAQ